MKEFIPHYILESGFDYEIIRFNQEGDDSYQISFYVKKNGVDNFIVNKSRHYPSPEFMQYRKKILKLQEKYKHLLINGNCFTTSFEGDKVYFGYNNPQTGSVTLEELTDIKNLSNISNTPEIITLTIAATDETVKLFDSSLNGYDALTNEINYSSELLRFKKKTKCLMCGCNTYKVIINIHSTGKKDLLRDQPCDEINEKNWTDAFAWFSIDLECSNCGRKTRNWFEIETM